MSHHIPPTEPPHPYDLLAITIGTEWVAESGRKKIGRYHHLWGAVAAESSMIWLATVPALVILCGGGRRRRSRREINSSPKHSPKKISCRPSGDCGGSRDRTQNCCIAELPQYPAQSAASFLFSSLSVFDASSCQ
jgi:hypothetical protein